MDWGEVRIVRIEDKELEIYNLNVQSLPPRAGI